MVLLSASFPDETMLDFAYCELRKKMNIKYVLVQGGKADNSLPVNYPVNGEFSSSLSDYLDGRPHITDGGMLLNDYSRLQHQKEVKLAFLTDAKNEQTAKSILRKYSGYGIKSCH